MPKRLTILSLILPVFVNYIPPLITSLLIIEIASSYNIEVGVAGQLFTLQSIASAMMALLMGVLSVRYSYKSLLIVGVVFSCVSSVSCTLSPTFGLLLVGYSLTGISLTMVMTMSQALIGSLFPVQERPKILGYQMAGFAVAYVIGPHIINFLNDWRLAFSFFMFPLSLGSLALAFRGLPSTSSDKPVSQQYLQAFRAVFQNKSANACIIANVLFVMVLSVLHVYGIPFYREHFLVDKTSMSVLVTASSLSFVVGGVIGGRLVNRFGRKPLTILGMLLAGVQTIVYITVPNFWLSLALWIPSGFTVSLRNAGYSSLVIEQVPKYRGTMMSFSQFSANVAGALGSGLGGLILVTFDYGPMGVLGIAAIIAAVVVHVFTIDPTRQAKQQSTVSP